MLHSARFGRCAAVQFRMSTGRSGASAPFLSGKENPCDTSSSSACVSLRQLALAKPRVQPYRRRARRREELLKTQARGGEQLPFHGSLQAVENDVVAPPSLLVNGTGTGTGTHLGRFAATFTATVTLATGSATGSIRFIAANGDRLDATFIGQGTPTTEPNVVSIEEVATITGGTGRFAGATGEFTIQRVLNQISGVSSGSFDGTRLRSLGFVRPRVTDR